MTGIALDRKSSRESSSIRTQINQARIFEVQHRKHLVEIGGGVLYLIVANMIYIRKFTLKRHNFAELLSGDKSKKFRQIIPEHIPHYLKSRIFLITFDPPP